MTYAKSHLEDFIKNLYTKISISSPKQLNRRLNIEVEYSHKTSKCAEIDGIMMIRLNENLSKAEQWQEFAHEVCHLLRHSGDTLPFCAAARVAGQDIHLSPLHADFYV